MTLTLKSLNVLKGGPKQESSGSPNHWPDLRLFMTRIQVD